MYDILCTADDNTPTLSHQTTIIMISHPLQPWQHSPCIKYHTHCIYVTTPSPLTSHHLLYDITPTFCVTSYEVYITSQPIVISSNYSTYDITASLDDNIILFVCHGTHYVYDIISTIHDVTHTVCMKTQALYLTWYTFYLPSHLLYMSSHPLFRRHHTNYIRHHRWHIYAIMCTIHDTISTLQDNNP